MSTLVDDLLLLARLDEGRPQENEPIDLVAVVAEVAADARVVEPGRPLRLEVPDDPVVVLGDDGRLRQLFTNLLGNVRRYTDPGTECTVRVFATRTDATVTVADRGPGMAEADAARAFDRFYRADPSRSRDSGGTGLGLAIAKAITEAHGGTITLTTAPGAGVTVDVHLPRAQVGAEPERAVNRDATSRVAPTVRP
jgi:two-component system OmpR family sensor kinase